MVLFPVLRIGLLCALMNCASLYAAAEDRYGCATPVRLAFYPHPILYEDGKGMDVDVATELARRSGCRFEVSVRPRAQIWQDIESGEVDLTMSGVASPDRLRLAYFIPYLYLRERLIVPLEQSMDLHDLNDFRARPGVRLGVISGYRHGTYLDAILRIMAADGQLREYPDERGSFAALQKGEVNGLIGHALVLSTVLGDPAMRHRFRVIELNAPGVARGLVLSRRHFSAAQSAEWLRLLEDLRLDGGLSRILLRNAPLDIAASLLDNGYRAPAGDLDKQP